VLALLHELHAPGGLLLVAPYVRLGLGRGREDREGEKGTESHGVDRGASRILRSRSEARAAPFTLNHKVLDGVANPPSLWAMHPPEPIRPASLPPVPSRALENLRFIRETLERAASFTAVPGWGTALVGATAFPAAAFAAVQPTPGRWLAVWIGEGILACALGVGATLMKARRADVSLLSGSGGRFLLAFCPALAAGALLTLALAAAGVPRLLPGTWLLLYGAGLFSAAPFTLAVFRAMGVAFLAVGAATLFAPAGTSDVGMAAGFGGLHLFFGVRIARRERG